MLDRLRVLRDNVLVKRDLYPDKRGSVYVPTPNREHFSVTGVVISAGKKCKFVKSGDSVMWRVHHDRAISGRYAIVKEEDLVAINVEKFRGFP